MSESSLPPPRYAGKSRQAVPSHAASRFARRERERVLPGTPFPISPVRERLSEARLRVVQTPYQAPNANAYAERFVRSIKEECLSRVIAVGERHFRRTIAE